MMMLTMMMMMIKVDLMTMMRFQLLENYAMQYKHTGCVLLKVIEVDVILGQPRQQQPKKYDYYDDFDDDDGDFISVAEELCNEI